MTEKAKDFAVRAVKVLNEALEADPDAISRLMDWRVACNAVLAGHPSIQCRIGDHDATFSVGLLGIINGIIGVDDRGWGLLGAEYTLECPVHGCLDGRMGVLMAGSKCPVERCVRAIELGRISRFCLMEEAGSGWVDE